MNTTFKLTVSGLLLAGSIAIAPSAFAAPCPSAGGTMQAWIGLGAAGCTVDDKIFRFGSVGQDTSPFDPNYFYANFTETNNYYTVSFVPFAVRDGGGNVTGGAYPFITPGTYLFSYTVDINPGLGAGYWFSEATAALSNPIPNTGTVTKTYTNNANGQQIGQIVTTGGAVSSGLSQRATSITVTESIVLTTGAQVFSLDNTMRQTNIPEPVSLALFGLGLVGIAAARRRQAA
jgi:hypothetical protein